MQRTTTVAIALFVAGAMTTAQETNAVQRNKPASPADMGAMPAHQGMSPGRDHGVSGLLSRTGSVSIRAYISVIASMPETPADDQKTSSLVEAPRSANRRK